MTSNEWYNQQDYYQLCYHENNSSSDNSSFFDESPLYCKILAADRRQNLYDTLPGGHSQEVSVFGKPVTNKNLERRTESPESDLSDQIYERGDLLLQLNKQDNISKCASNLLEDNSYSDKLYREACTKDDLDAYINYLDFSTKDNDSYDIMSNFQSNLYENISNYQANQNNTYVNIRNFNSPSSSSGISSSPSNSSEGSLYEEIPVNKENRNFGTKCFTRTFSNNSIDDSSLTFSRQLFAKSEDDILCSTPLKYKRLSLIGKFKQKNHIHDSDSDTSDSNKSKRSSSPIEFLIRRTKSLSSKEKSNNHSSSYDNKKIHLCGSYCNDGTSNENTLEQPSPFVRTIFQYVETSFDDDMFPLENITLKKICQSSDAIPIFGTIHMKNFQDSKLYKYKTRSSSPSSIILKIEQNIHEPNLISTGRRLSENSEFIVSVIAYLDRVRKAKSNVNLSSLRRRRKSRKERCKSDPGLSSLKIEDYTKTYNDDIKKQEENKSKKNLEKYHSNVIDKNIVGSVPVSMNQRFKSFSSNNSFNSDVMNGDFVHKDEIRSKSFSSVRSEKKSSLHRVRNTGNTKRKLANRKYEHKCESLSYELQKLDQLNEDLTIFSRSFDLNDGQVLSRPQNNMQTDFNESPTLSVKDNTSEEKMACPNIKNNTEPIYENLHFNNIDNTSSSVANDDKLAHLQWACELTNDNNNPNENKQGLPSQFQNVERNSPKCKYHNDQNLSSCSIMESNADGAEINDEHQAESPNGINAGFVNDDSYEKKTKSKQMFTKKIKRKYKKPNDPNEIEYWVGEFKSEREPRVKAGDSKILSFKKQFSGSFRRKDKRNKVEIKVESHEMNILNNKNKNAQEDLKSKKVGTLKRTPSNNSKKESESENTEEKPKEKNKDFQLLKSVFEAVSSPQDKRRWRISSPRIKSQKKISLLNYVKKDKNESSSVSEPVSPKLSDINYLQYNQSPRTVHRTQHDKILTQPKSKTKSSTNIPKSPQIASLRKHYEKCSNDSVYSSDESCSSFSSKSNHSKADSNKGFGEDIVVISGISRRRKSSSLDPLPSNKSFIHDFTKAKSSDEIFIETNMNYTRTLRTLKEKQDVKVREFFICFNPLMPGDNKKVTPGM